ncbi:hypothetical protein J7481_01405 [Labrenzia sp. R4_2]|uniref:hypothetical protein n=1 Tax=Labrenzia sp. R4_2 TaxID=2821107 RepID=UPI001AD9AC62|nr:hypothetical protein [Labrenzia sp. R4_2]MBO9418135.1 hypothetical protein [Labrenzia sp. R4_2]
MSEKDKPSQDVADAGSVKVSTAKSSGAKTPPQSREDRLAEALRANLRRRKSAAHKSKTD